MAYYCPFISLTLSLSYYLCLSRSLSFHLPFIYIYVCVCVCVLPTTPLRIGWDTCWICQRSRAGLNSNFFFFWSGCLKRKQKNPGWPTIYSLLGGQFIYYDNSVKWNAITIVQDFNSCHYFHHAKLFSLSTSLSFVLDSLCLCLSPSLPLSSIRPTKRDRRSNNDSL